ncbi:MAG: PilZ domain-containing protein [Gammaproteobacteria bacterium]|nr:PilZ domain-containing protein [Gammaproteobacteria bacterium]
MSNNLENRRSFRVSESVYLKVDKLTEEEFAAGIDHRNLRLGINDNAQSMLVDIEARLSEAMYLLNSEHGALGRCITLMNDKMNIVIDELPALRENKASLASLPPQTCDVGADGMVFSSSEPFAVGDKLHMRFLLSTDSRYAESFAQVLRLTDPPATDSPHLTHGIAVEFVNLPVAQREILIQHMFNRESETLRMRRLEIESAQ